MEQRVAAIIGVGPGLGAALCRRFAREGFSIAMLARSRDNLAPVAEAVRALGPTALPVEADVTSEASLRAALELVAGDLGPPEVLVYNAGAFHMGDVLEIRPDDFERCWKANCAGALVAAQAVLPAMLDAGRGSILFTGATASLRGAARFAALAVGKAGLRMLAQSMARELGPRGIHVGHVVIDGQIDTPRLRSMMPDRATETLLAPDAIAEAFWQLHAQDRSAWTLELDVRPNVEKF
jgi:NAD(P)-dependent dehydrogenase (short-subunit alcohol dehydrogenase family)